ncbi:MAG: hypothetical protein ACSHW1_04685 [Yoonia sp.]|uniref:hypothetical protein n=1 Tax=Yoonia sp. TaxID=2212373 RepID=UPI003EF179AA
MRYLALAAVLFFFGALIAPNGQASRSATVLNILSETQILCKRYSVDVGDHRIGCRSFADVRKIEMRADNRTRSIEGERVVRLVP